MNKYSCGCPAPGCGLVFSARADGWEEAFRKIYKEGNRHIIEKHPDFPEPVDRDEYARRYAKKNFVIE